jgi:transposase InsO family protein
MPFEDLGVDFTEVKPCREYWYFSVLVCTYSGWVEAYPATHTEKAQEVVKALLREIIPRYGLPLSIRSDNGAAFMVEIIQDLAKFLKIKWKLHTTYRLRVQGK